jgi:hypothetical protein
MIHSLMLMAMFLPMASHTPLDLSQVQNDDHLIVGFESVGCYHGERYQFRFQFTDHGADVEVVQWSTETGDWRFLHKRSLTKNALGRIQNTLVYYRKSRTGGCTTEERLTFALYKKGKRLLSESYRDQSCRSYEDATLFRWIELI